MMTWKNLKDKMAAAGIKNNFYIVEFTITPKVLRVIATNGATRLEITAPNEN